MSQQVTITRQHSFNGEVLSYADKFACDGVTSLDVPCAGGLSRQHAVLAVNVAKVQSVFIASNQPVTLYANGTDAVQTFTIGGGATAGSFTATYGGQTATIPFGSTGAAVTTLLQALSSILANNVLVTGPVSGVYTLTWGGVLGLQPITNPSLSAAGLTGGTPTATPASVTTGVVPTQTITLPANDAIDWVLQDGFPTDTCPFTGNISLISVTNPGTVLALVQMRIGQNA